MLAGIIKLWNEILIHIDTHISSLACNICLQDTAATLLAEGIDFLTAKSN